MNALLSKLYIINLSLLVTHEIDSAYWHEWELFGIPGGIQVFLVLNFIFIIFFLAGFESICNSKKSGKKFSFILSLVGLAAFFIHLYFVLEGNTEFLLPVSILILMLILLASTAQLFITIKYRDKLNEN